MIRHWRIVGKIKMSWYQLTIDREALPAPGHRWSSRWPKRSETCDQRLLIIWGPTDPKWCKEFEFAARVGKKIGGAKRYWLDLMNIVGIYASLQVCIRLQSITCIQETGTWCLSPFVQVKQLEMETWHKNSHFQVGKLQSKDWVKSEIGSCSTYMYSWESSGEVEGLCNHFSGLISQRHRSSGWWSWIRQHFMVVDRSTRVGQELVLLHAQIFAWIDNSEPCAHAGFGTKCSDRLLVVDGPQG